MLDHTLLEKKKIDLTSSLRIWFVLCASSVLVYLSQDLYPNYIGAFSSILTPLSAAGAFVSSSKAAARYGFMARGRISTVVSLACIAMGLSMTGEFIRSAYFVGNKGQIPYPSLGDAFILSCYALLFAALLIYMITFVKGLPRLVSTLVEVGVLVTSVLGFFYL